MKKGKFGIVLCFYPIAAFAAVILDSPLVCLALTAAAVFLEKDEWTSRQTLQAWMLSVVLSFFEDILRNGINALFGVVPFFSSVLSAVFSVASAALYLAAIIFSILAILRVSKDDEANIPLASSLAYRIYGKVRPKPAPVPPYAAPYQAPQPPAGYPYQDPNANPNPQAQPPYAPPYPPQTPPPAPQYTPPVNPDPAPQPSQPEDSSNGPSL